ncbi:MAG: glycosyltransferase family 2 protein [Coriobacteriia bacterium]|nr:glycosyltransferase family 2 protein [Coriobacteriia bacterium]
MYKSRTVGVVVPCHNEATQIGRVIDTMPDFVDRIIIVDDVSSDATVEVVRGYVERMPERVRLIVHERNGGVGAAIVTGYKAAVEEQIEMTAVMAGDAQMDPADLPALLDPVAAGEIDYSKGNRLFTGESWRKIPKVRYLGNSALSLMTKIVSGYWNIADSQTGYTVANLRALSTIDLDALYPRYGFPNDMLVQLNIYDFRVRDVPIHPVYDVGERSGIRLWKVIPTISWLLFRRFWYRMFQKYVIRDTHPLVLFYITGMAFSLVGFYFGVLQVIARVQGRPLSQATVVLSALLLISGLQFLFFAMWFDMEHNRDLR